MQNTRCRRSEPRHPLAKYNRKFYSNFWRILSEKRIFLAQKYRSWVKISKIATIRLFNTVRWVGSPIFMSFRQRNRCDLDWRHFFVSENPKACQIWPGMTTRNGKPMVSHRLGREVWEILRFFGQEKSPVKITSIPLTEWHENWWPYRPNGIKQSYGSDFWYFASAPRFLDQKIRFSLKIRQKLL